MFQIRDFENNLHKLTHGLDDCPTDNEYPFDYCFKRSASGVSDMTPSIAVPGHSGKGRSRQHGKSPKMSLTGFSKSPKSPGAASSKSPSGGACSKSPGSSFMSMSDDQLKQLKMSMEDESYPEESNSSGGAKPKTIKFADEKGEPESS